MPELEEANVEPGQEPKGDAKENLVALRESLAEKTGRNRALEDENARLRASLEERPPPSPAPAPESVQVPSRAELRALVDAGRMTEDEMQERLEGARDARLKGELTSTVDARLEAGRQTAQLEGEFARYRALKPDIWVRGSDDSNRVLTEVERLISRGFPRNHATELEAIRTTFGTPEALEAVAGATTVREPHVEEGGGGPTGDEPRGTTSQWGTEPKGVPAYLQRHFLNSFEVGAYTGWDDPNVKRELELAKKHPPRRRASG